MSRIFGIDPASSRMAWFAVDAAEPLVYLECGFQDFTKAESDSERPGVEQWTYQWATASIDHTDLIYVEEPFGNQYRAISRINRVIGALIAAHPDVQLLHTAAWKRKAGLKGNATKPEVRTRASIMYPDVFLRAEYEQDVYDAALIAYAGATINKEMFPIG